MHSSSAPAFPPSCLLAYITCLSHDNKIVINVLFKTQDGKVVDGKIDFSNFM